MWGGPPPDVPGECNARLSLGDDYGDNSCTIRCKLVEGHDGDHCEGFDRNGGPVKIIWQIDDREPCIVCGKLTTEYWCSQACSETARDKRRKR